MIDLYAELTAVLQVLEAARVPYALCGGIALMVYQRPRATVDIDLVLPSDLTASVAAAIAPLGFRPHPRPIRFEKSGIDLFRLYKLEPGGPDVLMLDCLLTTHPTVAAAWRTRVQVPFEDRAVWVVSIEGLISLKRLRGSPMDALDIDALQALLDQTPDMPDGGDLA